MSRNDVNESQRKALLKSLSNQADEKADELEYLLKREAVLKNIISKIPDPEPVKTVVGGTIDDNNKPSAVDIATKAETERYYEELSQLKKSYLNSETMTQKDYQALSEDLERQHLEKMLEIQGLEPEKRRQIQDKLLEMQIKYKEECKRLDEEDREKIPILLSLSWRKRLSLNLMQQLRNTMQGFHQSKSISNNFWIFRTNIIIRFYLLQRFQKQKKLK